MHKSVLFLLFFGMALVTEVTAQSCSAVVGSYNPSSGPPLDTRHSQINCHQYVRTALLNNDVNPNTGRFYDNITPSGNSTNIANDDRFVQVCQVGYAQAISFTNSDHSAIKLNTSYPTYASTPGVNSYVYGPHAATQYSGGTSYKYYAVLPEVTGSSSLSSGNSSTYSTQSKNYIQSISWSVSSSSLQIVGSNTGYSVTVQASCGSGSGTYQVEADLTIKDSNEVVTISKTVTVTCSSGTSCFNNTLDGNTLNTFNYVSPNADHEVIMDMSRTWNKSWGSTTYWYTSNNGKQMNFALSYGCATFTAYNGSCGTQTFTFCASSYMRPPEPHLTLTGHEAPYSTPFKVFDFYGRTVREGILEDYQGSSPLKLLPNGLYILRIHDTSQKIYINDE